MVWIASCISATIRDEQRKKDKELSEELGPDEKAELVEHHQLFLLVLLRSASRMSRILILLCRRRRIAGGRARSSTRTARWAPLQITSCTPTQSSAAAEKALARHGTQEPPGVVLRPVRFWVKCLYECRVQPTTRDSRHVTEIKFPVLSGKYHAIVNFLI